MNYIIGKLKDNRTRSTIFLLITAVLWSLGGLMIKSIHWNAVAIAGSRSFIASLLMLVILKKPSLKFDRYKLGSAVAYACTVISFVAANKFTAAATAILLHYTAPIYVALFSAWFLKERIARLDWIVIFLVIGGMILFFVGEMSAGSILGNVLAILSGVGFAFIVLLLRKQKDENPLESVFWGNVLTAIIGLPFMFTSVPDTASCIGILFIGVFQLGLPYILYAYAIKHVSALEATLIPIIEPILNPLWVFLALGESPGPWAFLGGFIVLSSIIGRSVININKAKRIG